ncbi:MAG TPA: L-aspartate oxidase [Spirochaetota bacterium]|nr:L-aspartate oxidase [Spirochaetota bacterium]HNT12359.1 L-aspartate oxidase [Spirochaetota bacterium]HNV46232.1 L-aspartate oxidase [Spirochaetota bacterium]HPI22323.1 L-aspartate oxidase [Spirochaetota bacterium]HPU87833.1 L-aspartate oxidase [Spirochaetota bacterium]
MNPRRHHSDFLVIGSGIAGLAFAIKAAALGSVNIVTKKKDSDSNTNYAQGGIASVLSPEDSIDEHIADTLKAGAGLCNAAAVEILVRNGPERIAELMEWGTRFSTRIDREGTRALDLGREGGHSHNRIAHAKDLTGQEIERALINKISTMRNIAVFEDHTAVDLLTEHQLRLGSAGESSGPAVDPITCYGAYILENETGTVHIFTARCTLLASGGAGQVYLHTSNPDIATGDGIAMAYRAGAFIADMEFIQFHPTTLHQDRLEGRSFLISEAVRGEGALLFNSRGERFMEGEHELKELAPRDIVARAIDRELKRLGDRCVYLDITAKGEDFLRHRFPLIYENCLKAGYDMARERIPVVPAAHYLCGGIVSDTFGRTAIRNLFVSGESACTGVHGANRLASNSLLEGVVFSHRAFLHLADTWHGRVDAPTPEFPHWNKEGTFDLEEWILIQHNVEDVKRLMWDYVGIVRSDLRLQRAYRRIILIKEEILDYYRRSTISPRLIELRNLATIAKLIIQSALARKESRGLHYNTSYPFGSEQQRKNVVLRAGQPPSMTAIDTLPVA